MRSWWGLGLVGVVAVLLMSCASRGPRPAAAPPVAERRPTVREWHGDRFGDDYFWLRERTNPAVLDYLKAENAYTEAAMRGTERLQRTLFREMVGRLQETDVSVPVRKGDWLYYSRTAQGRQYPILCRKAASGAAGEQVLLDVNDLARGKPFMSVGSFEVSDDARLLAYTTDEVGFRQYRLHVKDLTTGRRLELEAERVTSVRWAADQRTLFYSVEHPVTKRSHALYRQTLGGAPELVRDEQDERFSVFVDRTRSGGYLVVTCQSRTAREVRVLDAARPDSEWRLVAAREPEHEYDLDHHGDRFFIRSNRAGRNFALFSAPVSDPSPAQWRAVLPHRDDTMVEAVMCFEGHYILHLRQEGLVKFELRSYDGGEPRSIAFPEATYAASPDENPEFRSTTFRYSYESPITPPSVYEHEVRTHRETLLKRREVKGGYDPARYRVERRQARARDGTLVPISILRRADLPLDGTAPCLLEGYGSYGISNDAGFSSALFCLADRGVVCATAHIRGGGELGKAWHEAGRTATKMNTFTDFIDCAEFLVAERYTSPQRLVITGGSAGGLLMGAVTNLRPDLFKAVVTYVPFVDVINTMLDESLPLTVEEFEEWGNPKVAREYAWMRAYCPYTNLEAKTYPSILVKTSLHDSQVMYWEPAKYVARLRTLKTDANPLLLHVNLNAGHGGASGRYDHLKERAFDYAFVLRQVGL